MHNKKYIELINKKIDGCITAEEEKALSAYLQHSKEGRLYMEEMEKSMGMLDMLEQVDPPLHLKDNIIASIDHELYMEKPQARKSQWWHAFLPAPKMALAFTCGLLLGIVMISVFVNEDLNNTEALSGTIGLQQQLPMPVITQIEVDALQVSGRIDFQHSAGIMILDTHLQNKADDLQLLVEYDPQHFAFVGYKNMDQTAVQLQDNIGLLKVQVGSNYNAQLLFDKLSGSSTMVNVTISSAQKTLLSKRITIEGKKN